MACAVLDGPRAVRNVAPARGIPMTDLTIVVLTLAMFAACAGFLRLCQRM